MDPSNPLSPDDLSTLSSFLHGIRGVVERTKVGFDPTTGMIYLDGTEVGFLVFDDDFYFQPIGQPK